MSQSEGKLWAIVLAGGEGVRLRALTRQLYGVESSSLSLAVAPIPASTWFDLGTPERVARILGRSGAPAPSWLGRLRPSA